MKTPPLSSSAAFISDIHGNLKALDAILETLDRLHVKHVFAAGDHLLGGEDPLGVWRRLVERKVRLVRGLSDTALVSVDLDNLDLDNLDDAAAAKMEAFVKTRQDIGDLVMEQIRRLPQQLRIPLIDGREVLMVHGSPQDPHNEMSHDMDDDELEMLLYDEVADVVVCGASHIPFRRRIGDIELVALGSVGASPDGETAHYTVLTPRMEGLEIAQDYIRY